MKAGEKFNSIPGWFTKSDQKVFSIFLNEHRQSGDLLEIGVYRGKSAVFIANFLRPDEVFHVCDIFEMDINESENRDEVSKSYEGLNLKNFKSTFLSFHKTLPEIHVCNSKDLSAKLIQNDFRFIHIDGSHLYDYVKNDLAFASLRIRESDGIIAMDDFRSAHTPGVAAAMWEIILGGSLVPVVITGTKAYLAHPNNILDYRSISKSLERSGLETEILKIRNHSFIRVIDNFNGYEGQRFPRLRMLLPPIILSYIHFLRKKIRKHR
jgi:hypothetical protein